MMKICLIVLLSALLLAAIPLCAQSNTGELRIKVTDPAGLGVKSSVQLVSEANQIRKTLLTDDAGNLVAIHAVTTRALGNENLGSVLDVGLRIQARAVLSPRRRPR